VQVRRLDEGGALIALTTDDLSTMRRWRTESLRHGSSRDGLLGMGGDRISVQYRLVSVERDKK
jgi:hypothetical protein